MGNRKRKKENVHPFGSPHNTEYCTVHRSPKYFLIDETNGIGQMMSVMNMIVTDKTRNLLSFDFHINIRCA